MGISLLRSRVGCDYRWLQTFCLDVAFQTASQDTPSLTVGLLPCLDNYGFGVLAGGAEGMSNCLSSIETLCLTSLMLRV